MIPLSKHDLNPSQRRTWKKLEFMFSLELIICVPIALKEAPAFYLFFSYFSSFFLQYIRACSYKFVMVWLSGY